MKTENDWRPEVGGKAWVISSSGHVLEVMVDSIHEEKAIISSYLYHIGREARVSCRLSSLYPTAEAAMANVKIKVYDLEGEEVNLQRKSTFELKPLEWKQDVDNEKCESAKCGDEWKFYASSEGYGHIYFRHEVIFYTNRSSMDEAKAAIQDWRLKHLHSLL